MVFEGSYEKYYDTRDALIMVEWCNFTVYLVFTSRVYLFLMLPNNLTDNVIHIIAFNLLTFHPQKWAYRASTYTHTEVEMLRTCLQWRVFCRILVGNHENHSLFFDDSYKVGAYKSIPLESYFVQFLFNVMREFWEGIPSFDLQVLKNILFENVNV